VTLITLNRDVTAFDHIVDETRLLTLIDRIVIATLRQLT